MSFEEFQDSRLEALEQHKDSELLKLYRSDIQDGRH